MLQSIVWLNHFLNLWPGQPFWELDDHTAKGVARMEKPMCGETPMHAPVSA